MSTESKSSIPVVLLFGPTAVGKTSLTGQLFHSDFEIINADSRQVYRYLDIGTAKPPGDLLRLIPHHLIDILDPTEQFDVGTFIKNADLLAQEIVGRGHVPVISGGTAFYFYHFVYGLPPVPPADEEIREHLANRFRMEGREVLWTELKGLDPESAGRINPGDSRRLLRALEVYEVTGRTLSSFKLSREPRPGYRYLAVGLNREREELYRRIDRRVDEMWNSGLPEEFCSLLARGYGEEDPGMRGIGYREFFQMRRSGEMTFTGVKEEIKKNSRRYAKRQLTFFKKISWAEWYHPDQREDIARRVRVFLDG